jgi:hypothetical protein
MVVTRLPLERVLGLEDRIRDQLPGMLVCESIEHPRAILPRAHDPGEP